MGFNLLRTQNSRGFTLIEILVALTVIFTILNLSPQAEIQDIYVTSEDVNGSSPLMTFETKVRLECPSQNGWATILNPETPGFVELPSGVKAPITIVKSLSVVPLLAQPSKSAGFEPLAPSVNQDLQSEAALSFAATNSLSDADPFQPKVEYTISSPNSENQVSLAIEVSYPFEEISQTCETKVSFEAPRDEFVDIDSSGVWIAREAHLVLNLFSIHTENFNALGLLPQELFEFLQNNAQIVSSAESNVVSYSATSSFAGVTIGNGAGGGALVTSGGAENSMSGGCGLMRITERDSSSDTQSFPLLWFFGLVFGGLVILMKAKSFSNRRL